MRMRVKKGIRNSIILPTLSHASDMDVECSTAKIRIWAVDMSNTGGGCDVLS